MSVEADLTLDVRQALNAAQTVGSVIDQVTRAILVVDTSGVAGEVQAAVDAADTAVAVTVSDVDTATVAPEVEAAVDAADTQVTVEADTGGISGEIQDEIDGADTTVTPEFDPGPISEGMGQGFRTGEQQAPASGSRSGGEFAKGFTSAVQGALDALPDVTVGADTSEADREIASIRDELLRLSDESVGVTISDDEAQAVIGRLQERLQQLDSDDVSVGVRVDAGAAESSLSGFTDALEDSDGAAVALAASGGQLSGVLQTLAGLGVAKGLFEAAQAASDLEEATSKATVVFGAGIDEIQEFSSTSATSLGLANKDALEITATFGNLLNALGLSKEAATELSPEIVTLGADLASFNNLAVDETLEKIRSGLVGEIEPLRSLGVSFDAAAVEAKAMELGLADARGEISEGAKVQARWQLILEQSSNAQGDFARTSDGLANQQRILSAEFGNVVTNLGQLLLPALLDGVEIVRSDLLPAFEEAGTRVLPALADIFLSLLPLAGSFANILVATAPAATAVAAAIASLPPELITVLGLMAAFKRVGGSDLFQNLKTGFQELADPARGPGGFGKSLKASVGQMITANAGSFALTGGLAVLSAAFEANARKAADFQRVVSTIEKGLDEAFEGSKGAADAFAGVFETLVEQGGSAANVLAAVGIDADDFGRSIARGESATEAFSNAVGVSADELGVLKLFLDDFDEQIKQAAESQVEAIKASSGLSDAFVDATVKANSEKVTFGEVTTTTTDYVAVLNTLNEAQRATAEQIGITVDETGQLVQATGPAADAADRLVLSLAALQQGGGDFTKELAGVAIAAGDARIAQEDLQDVADELGVSLDDLETFVGSVNDAINQFADDTLSTIPSVGDIIGDLGDDFSPEALLEKLETATEGIANFSTNLEDLAAFPRVQQLAAENGPLVAAALAKPVQDGNTDVIAALEEQIGAFDLHYAGLDGQLRNEFGPQLAEATGLTGQLATEAFGDDFTVASVAEQQARGTIASIEDEDANMTAASEGFGKSGTAGFSTGVAGMPVAAVSASEKSTAAVASKRAAALIAGAAFGGGFSSGTGSGSAGMPSAAASAANTAIAEVKARQKAALSAGYTLGNALASGMSSGIAGQIQNVANQAAALVEAAIAKANAKAEVSSPSKLFARLGEQMAAGVVVGLDKGTDAVAVASAGLVDAATFSVGDAASQVSLRTFDTGSGGSGGITVTGVPGMVQISVPGSATPEEAVAVGRLAARGFVDGLLERQLTAAATTS